ncbi:16S rRNA (uracil(1498)-N(3))-methyltransferase [Deinococcus maricopensis]|uniref:Ribosomal RNA small subunit methyltransferase E n=1 Tax=Deinococcus maricopensis (strain DSM 21211 / LMG 22137 / NRRL B-23946 / LB-34) TaxID=709986 RepID=E8UB30_DEIML|nr:16S rRNA (uracil(1498)-N(3))-methyltransferase [Deinococcus maricopensis]ADV68269.1 Ribosomal RNA small subunit methyltransferase E [Deinococcus maricopensis DSM 21211]
MHRVKVDALTPEMSVPAREWRHLRVLRLRAGDTIRVFDGRGAEAEATVSALHEGGATLTLGASVEGAAETPQPVTLAIALLKGDKLADVTRAATELGVARIQLLTSRYADVPDIGPAKLERLRRIALEASKQSRRAVTPDVLAPIPVTQLRADGPAFIAHPGTHARLTDHLTWDAPVTVVSGPEGGWTDAEVTHLERAGFTPVTLGPRILRAETAPLALLGAIVATGV